MSWTYDPTLDGDRDWIRFRLGDTDTTDQLLQDEEIDGVLALTPTNRTRAAATCAISLAGKFARKVDYSNMSLSVSASQRMLAFQKLAAVLDREASTSAVPVNLAQSQGAKEGLDENTDAVRPVARIGQDDFPGGGGGNNVVRTNQDFLP